MACFQEEAEKPDAVTGISVAAAETITSELGVNMDSFPSEKGAYLLALMENVPFQ
jgi:hypothetical protein